MVYGLVCCAATRSGAREALPLVSPGHVTCSRALIGHLLRRPVDGGVGGARGGELAHGGAVQPLTRDVHPEQRGVAAVVTLE